MADITAVNVERGVSRSNGNISEGNLATMNPKNLTSAKEESDGRATTALSLVGPRIKD